MGFVELFVAGVGSLAAICSAAAAFLAVRATIVVAATQKALAQRQLILPLWEHMRLKSIDPKSPNVDDVWRAVNTLELVALCCEGGMVDEQVMKRTFRNSYIQLYDEIAACPEMPALGRSGQVLLRENPAAMAFYKKLDEEHMDRDKLVKV